MRYSNRVTRCQATVICAVSVEIDPYSKALHVVHALEAVTPGSFRPNGILANIVASAPCITSEFPVNQASFEGAAKEKEATANREDLGFARALCREPMAHTTV